MFVIKINYVYYCKDFIFESLYIGMFWIEIDYLIGINISVFLYQQLKEVYFEEIEVVNVMYIYGFVVIILMKS